MIQWIAFVLGSIIMLIFSWASLHHPDSHGFYRFFAWEVIFGLVLIDAPIWFHNPFSWNQIISWILLIASPFPVALGIYQLSTRGNPDKVKRTDPGLIGFERTTQVVDSGIYQYIRHPIYSSLLSIAWGTFFKSLDQTGITLTLIAMLFLYATAKAEEAECMQVFGTDYQNYMKRTKMFIPYVF